MRSVTKSQSLPNLVFAISIVLCISAYLFCRIWDSDIWWHIPIGKEIIARLSVPKIDHFTAAAMGRPYHDSHWLFQVAVAAADSLGGMIAVHILAISIWIVTLYISYRSISYWLPQTQSLVILLLLSMSSIERFIPRPEIITYLMIAVFYFQLMKSRIQSKYSMLLLVLLQLIWTNSHGLFVVGPFMAGCYWVREASALVRARHSSGLLRQYSILILLLVAATVTPPHGLENWHYAYLLFTEVGSAAPKYLQGLGELSPVFGRNTISGLAFWFYLILLFATIATTARKLTAGKISFERLLIVAAFFVLSLSGRRNMVIFALTAAPFLAENYSSLVSSWRSRLVPMILLPFVAGLAFFGFSGRYHRAVDLQSDFGLGASTVLYSSGVTDFIGKINYRGQVFNSNILGGFFLYHAYPHLIPLTDGRWEIYDPALFENDFKAIVKRFDINAFLLQHDCPDAKAIYPDLVISNEWRLVYYDYTSSFWLRNDTLQEIGRIDPSIAGSLPPQAQYPGSYLMLDSFLRLYGPSQARIANLERGMQIIGKKGPILEALGKIQVEAGAISQAEQTFLLLVQKSPKNAAGYIGLAYIAAEKKQNDQAEAWLVKGLKVLPDDRNIQKNLLDLREFIKTGKTGTHLLH